MRAAIYFRISRDPHGAELGVRRAWDSWAVFRCPSAGPRSTASPAFRTPALGAVAARATPTRLSFGARRHCLRRAVERPRRTAVCRGAERDCDLRRFRLWRECGANVQRREGHEPTPGSATRSLHTGDVAVADPYGRFAIVDRRKDMIITGGYNVHPAAIERVIAGHSAVAMVAVGSQADPPKGELARGYVVLRPGASATEAESIDHCRPHLAAYKLPRSVQFVEDLPKTSTGMIMRRELRKLD